ncbi:tetratricopeptide repeat protein [Burkholderia plantarii]|uniref:TPR end-of-group domain-containing protein n=1 Tax=Burkholderia plantarii TaxID=41899 RepID=UPI00272AB075|nr:tetratricopeptide repeat protein [Burkholderia plantarii]WLE62624.1 tetratricopeptide repeat protein [Burkholderia plantarii]
MANYKCRARGDCDRAERGEVFVLSPGENLNCPGCGLPLELLDTETRKPTSKVSIAAAVAGIVVLALAGGGYYYSGHRAEARADTRQASTAAMPASTPSAPLASAPVATVAGQAPASVPAAPVIASGPSGIAPTDADIAALRKQGDEKLAKADAAGAEAASNDAAAKEMIKVAIADMTQGKLDDADKALSDAAARAPKQSLVYYNLGVLRLRQGRTDDALKALDESFQLGFAYFDQMAKDTDLDSIRNDPRFVALLKKYHPATV